MKKRKVKKCNKGIITIPFLLVLVIILFLTLSFLGLIMTFVHISVSQYMSYSTARRLLLSQEDIADQKNMAVAHYEKLRKEFFAPDAHTGRPGDWFSISKTIDPAHHVGLQSSFPDSNTYRKMFYGAGLNFSSIILKFQIPGLIKDDGPPIPPMRILSFLGREPSQGECELKFNKKRGDKICQLAQDRGIPMSDCAKDLINASGKGDNGC